MTGLHLIFQKLRSLHSEVPAMVFQGHVKVAHGTPAAERTADGTTCLEREPSVRIGVKIMCNPDAFQMVNET